MRSESLVICHDLRTCARDPADDPGDLVCRAVVQQPAQDLGILPGAGNSTVTPWYLHALP